MTQRITLQCPEGHKLTVVRAALVDLLGFGGHAGITASPPASLNARTESLRARCEGCVRAGRAATLHTVPFRRLVAILAAQHTYGPAHVTMTATRTGGRQALHRIIPDGDPRRDQRRETFDRVLVDLADQLARARPRARDCWVPRHGEAVGFTSDLGAELGSGASLVQGPPHKAATVVP